MVEVVTVALRMAQLPTTARDRVVVAAVQTAAEAVSLVHDDVGEAVAGAVVAAKTSGGNGEPADFVSDAPLEEWAGILEMHPNGYGFPYVAKKTTTSANEPTPSFPEPWSKSSASDKASCFTPWCNRPSGSRGLAFEKFSTWKAIPT